MAEPPELRQQLVRLSSCEYEVGQLVRASHVRGTFFECRHLVGDIRRVARERIAVVSSRTLLLFEPKSRLGGLRSASAGPSVLAARAIEAVSPAAAVPGSCGDPAAAGLPRPSAETSA